MLQYFWHHTVISVCRFLTFIYDFSRRSRDRMVVRYTTTYGISTYHH
jgi:hypothetical protein